MSRVSLDSEWMPKLDSESVPRLANSGVLVVRLMLQLKGMCWGGLGRIDTLVGLELAMNTKAKIDGRQSEFEMLGGGKRVCE